MTSFFILTFAEISSSQVFQDRTKQAGFIHPGLGVFPVEAGHGTNGIAVADYNRDGNLDVYFVTIDRFKEGDELTWNRLFSGNGNGTFQDVTEGSGLKGENHEHPSGQFYGFKIGASWGDFNNNGYPDLFMTHMGRDQLYRNNGDGTFTNITESAGVGGKSSQYSTTGIWFDYNNNGLLDLFVCVWEDDAQIQDKRNRMYENLGDGTFKDISIESGLASVHIQGLNERFTWMAIPMDVNGNGYMDLYLANDFDRNELFINNGDGTFTERTEEFNLEDPNHGMGLAVTDLTKNGFFDIYLTNISGTPLWSANAPNPLFINTGKGFFENKATSAGVSVAGWGWATEFFDHNNNGLDDLIVMTGHQTYAVDQPPAFFRNISDGNNLEFESVADEVGLNHTAIAMGMLIFDYNNNGHPDVLVSNLIDRPILYENTSREGNWLKVGLEGTESNRSGFGAVVEVHAGGVVYKKLHHGVQLFAQNIQPLHFGLGENEMIDQVIVRWPLGHVDAFSSVDVNQTVYVEEAVGIHVSVENQEENSFPGGFELIGNYPNPFNSSTNIVFKLNEPGEVNMTIFNILGQKIETRTTQFSSAGEKNIRWDAAVNRLNSGVYFYELRFNNQIRKNGKMIYLK